MDIQQLPPMPDRHTGEPRPPAAPLVNENSTSEINEDSPREKAPRTPPGEAEALEWHYPSRLGRVTAGLFVTAVGLAMYIFQGGFSWMGNIWLWLLLALPPFVFLLVGRRGKVSAGVDWVAYTDKKYVKTYRLKQVTVHIDGIAHMVQLVDDEGRSMRPQVSDLQANHRLWDLVYNGILHSVHVNGAETNKRAREYLQLDHPPHLRDW
ncbi:hypothetical protein BJF85_08595 [Saccharomonospora sp. CUA-673]|uniref:hypothetical protein n=1 Tax=Saccharomonospora sp. CUA-673 TaxID=1904969 RepID=UPI00096845EF|nr:hypothetical protein [Saccharomonospora sp. CUA-673]OLT38727.1 hypothetical protein BJF85_08595 [Saccharomonospora sp. CUA-673]